MIRNKSDEWPPNVTYFIKIYKYNLNPRNGSIINVPYLPLGQGVRGVSENSKNDLLIRKVKKKDKKCQKIFLLNFFTALKKKHDFFLKI